MSEQRQYQSRIWLQVICFPCSQISLPQNPSPSWGWTMATKKMYWKNEANKNWTWICSITFSTFLDPWEILISWLWFMFCSTVIKRPEIKSLEIDWGINLTQTIMDEWVFGNKKMSLLKNSEKKMAQWLRTLTSLLEVLSSIFSNHMVAPSYL